MADVVISDLPVITGLTADDYVIVNDGNATTAITSFADVLASITQVGIVGFADGTEQNPAITFTGDPNVGIYRPGVDEWAVSTNATQRLVINAAGNIGINNQSPGSWNSGSNNLVIGDVDLGDNGITIVSAANDVGNISFSDGTGATELAPGRIRYDHTDDHMSISTVGVEAGRITSDQEFLLGTTVPVIGSKIVVAGGNISVPSGIAGLPSVNFATDTDTGVWNAAPDHVSVATAGIERLTVGDTGNLYLAADSDTHLSHPADNVLAVTNNGVETARFDANNNIQLSGAVPTIFTNQNEMRLSVDADNDGAASAIAVYVDGGELGRFSPTGLGIGTITPNAHVHISGNAAAGYLRIDGQPGSGILFGGASTNILNLGGELSVSTSGVEALRIDTAGNVGIGSDPAAKLDVSGSVIFDGDLTFTGASAAGTFLSTPVANSLAITTNGTERFRVGDGGAIGLGGANYGTSGQVLTSAGPGAQPTWVSLAAGVPDISTLPALP